jgi:SAM-dependent methyltransferase
MQDLRVDYSVLAQTYDDRYDEYGLDGIRDTLFSIVERDRPEYVLETGCGSGNWLEALYGRVTHLYGLDYSTNMLQCAGQRRIEALLSRGDSARLPYANSCLDMIFCVNAIHHFGDPAVYISEVKRVLRRGGKIVVIGMDPRSAATYWYAYDYFPEAYENDLRRFPDWGTLINILDQSGFTNIQFGQVDESHRFFTQDNVLDDLFLKKKTTSQLAALSDSAYQAGVERIREAVAIARIMGFPLGFRMDIPFYCLAGMCY